MPVNDEEGAIQILNEAQANRAVAEHQLNMKSSRSHVIYTYYIDRTKFTEESSTDAEGQFQFSIENRWYLHSRTVLNMIH